VVCIFFDEGVAGDEGNEGGLVPPAAAADVLYGMCFFGGVFVGEEISDDIALFGGGGKYIPCALFVVYMYEDLFTETLQLVRFNPATHRGPSSHGTNSEIPVFHSLS